MNPAEFANIAAAERDLWWYRGMRRILFRMLRRTTRGRKFQRVLEAGCGTGFFAAVLQREWRVPVTAVDLSAEGLRYARGMHLGRLAQSNLAALPFRDAAFDAVLSLDVIVHFPRGEESQPMKELSRVLEPSGLLVIRVSALDALRSRHSEFVMERQRFTRRRLMDLAQSCGIRVLRCSYANSLLMPVALAKFRFWEPLRRQPAASGVGAGPAWLDRILYRTLAFEASCLAAGLNFFLGQSLILIGEKSAQAAAGPLCAVNMKAV